MRFTTILIAALLVLGLASSRRADACGGGAFISDEAVAGIVIVAGAYAGTTIAMGIKDVVSDNHSRGYGIAETVIHAPIATLYGMALLADATNDDQYYDNGINKGLVIMTALHGALAAHGIYTIAKRRPSKTSEGQRPYQGPPGMFQVGRVTASVTPAPVHNGAGLGFTGAF